MKSRAAFTLLEVLAAAAVVGAAFTVLAQINIQGLRAEGTAMRRLEASLLADRVLSDMEAQLMMGVAPQVGRDEREMEGFWVFHRLMAVLLPVAASGLVTVMGGLTGLITAALMTRRVPPIPPA